MKKTLIILFLFFPLLLLSQETTIEYSLGYGTYSLKDIRNLQNRTAYEIEGLKITDGFPGYITHSLALGFKYGEHLFGPDFTYMTTGGRIHRADYSGSLSLDMILNGFRIGGFYRNYLLPEGGLFQPFIQIAPSAMLTSFKLREELTIFDITNIDESPFFGVGLAIEPSVGTTYALNNWLNLSLKAGYQIDLWGRLRYHGSKTNLNARWDGLRLSGGLVFMIPNK